MNEEKIKKEALEYLEDGKYQKDVSKENGIGVKTLQLHFKKLQDIDPTLNKLVLEKKAYNLEQGRKKGGENGVRVSKLEDKALEIATYIIDNQATIRSASAHFSIPKSTIYELLKKCSLDIKEELEAVALANKKKVSVADLDKVK